jgi:hypothetical protein
MSSTAANVRTSSGFGKDPPLILAREADVSWLVNSLAVHPIPAAIHPSCSMHICRPAQLRSSKTLLKLVLTETSV